MLIKFLVIFLLTGVTTQEQTTERKIPYWEFIFDSWFQLEKSAEVNFNQQIFRDLMEIDKLIQKYVINGASVPDEIKSKAIGFHIRRKIIDHTVKHLKAALLKSNYSENEEILNLADAIFNVNEKFFQKIICSVINESVVIVPMNKLIDELSSHRNTSQNVAALWCIESLLCYHAAISDDSLRQLTEKLENNTNLSPGEKSTIFHNVLEFEGVERNQIKIIKKILEIEQYDPNYEHFLKAHKMKIEKLKNQLPKYLSNLYFTREVCIRSVAFQDQYLWNTNDLFNIGYKLILRHGKPGFNESEGKWLIRRSSAGVFAFENKFCRNWYIQFSKVSASIPYSEISSYYGAFVGEDSVLANNWWKVEFFQNKIYLYNRDAKRYLCPLNVTSDFKIRGQIESPHCLWVVEEC